MNIPIGAVITSINGLPVDEVVKVRNRYYPASNEAARLRDLSQDILRSDTNLIEIGYEFEGNETVKKLTLYPKDSLNIYRWYPRDNPPSFRKLEENIGYVTLQSIKNEDVVKIVASMKDTEGIILDIRNYPSAFSVFSLGGYFVSGNVPFVKFTTGSLINPGEFSFTKPLELSNLPKIYKGKLVVLVNEFTQSSAEYHAMAFRAGDNTTIMGSTTAGADGNVSRFYLPGGLSTMISGIGVYYPDGKETQRVGIVPDIEVKPTIQGIKEGRDELMEAAIQFILEE